MKNCNAIGILLQTIGAFATIFLLIYFAYDRLQNKQKLWYLISLYLLSYICAILSLVVKYPKVVLSLSLIMPILTILFLGGFILLSAILQGTNSISSCLFCIVLFACFNLAGSILLLNSVKKIK